MSLAATRVTVGAADGVPYHVVIGARVVDTVPAMLGEGVQRVLLVHSRALRDTAATLRATLERAGLRVIGAEVPDGEDAKTAQVLASCWQTLGQSGFTRSDAVVGLGGGAVTDLAGFVAATWLRGVRVVQVPTTLLGMVDAAIGGKTGINTAEGKNLVGAFHPPAGVVCDLAALQTLPHADVVAGLAEVVKCGFIADPVILDLIGADPAAAAAWDSPVLRELIERSIAVKAGWSARTCASRGCGRSSTTATRSGTRSSRSSGSAGGTVRRSASGWCSPPCSAGSPGLPPRT